MYCRPRPSQVMPAVVHPTKCCVTHSFQNIVVPHIHPTHHTHVNHINYENQHSYPQTQSNVNQVTQSNVNMGPRPGVAGACSPGMGPGMGMGPGYGGPGTGVAGASTGMGPKQGPSFSGR
ncbi:CotD family spore coat protein [Cytobacillus firmus]|uniref:CotD family spore coat protein n=1 Tax=Cytobacillus firmus TaxID=1399 RepID=UPI00077C2558|nr:CotD family spore coat protein [Cytobacillus firmus]MBG9542963.1 Spore coat protein CotD [Cytobacillus firmus]MBG9546557.1 Spore coat protein CotD [Cytobacillus firmus]MBG9552888.1 Spore coat protein CotD [Cytobacillus firmus]MBG9556956.1 Spore coat protein CotD [Cytobacillus firmus]MBG9576419.1 Spore coat protein CotD [Cytobacillus firmus]